MGTVWIGIQGFPNYMVSDDGRVSNANTDNVLSEEVHDGGYKTVRLYKDGKVNKKYVHRLVAQAFLPNFTNKPIVNHKDSNKQNNHYTNLEWCSHQGNVRHAIDKGNKEGLRSDDVVKVYIDLHYNDMTVKDVATKYNTSVKVVSSIKNKRSYKDILNKIKVVKKIILE